MDSSVFVIGDGDGIRKRVESYLLSGELDSLGAFSSALTEAIDEIARLAVSTLESRIVFAGGDDISFITTLAHYDEKKMRVLMDESYRRTTCSISFGAGLSVEQAFINLRRAKAIGLGNLITSGLPENPS